MRAVELVPLPVRDRIRAVRRRYRWPMPLWRARGRGTFEIAGERLDFLDVGRLPHDWWAHQARRGAHEPEVAAFLGEHLRSGDAFFDVGAHFGEYTMLAARRVGPAGRVVAIEPDPATIALLLRNLDANGLAAAVDVVAAAAAGADGELRLDPLRVGQSTSRPGAEGTVLVRAVTLDGLCRDLGVWPDVVKMDIEGGEWSAFSGAVEALGRARAIVVEVHEDAIAAQGGDVERLLDQLRDAGKSVHVIDQRRSGNYNVAATAA